MSTFVWLDYSERERRKMLDVVDLFREHDTRDELGVGSVRDAFADMLFPGTSTIMTRARYFLLVPWTYRRLEKQRVGSAEIAAKARRAELSLIQPIEDSEDNDGNIGKVDIDDSSLLFDNGCGSPVHRLMRGPFRSVSVRPRLEIRFEDRLQDELESSLDHAIPDRRYR